MTAIRIHKHLISEVLTLPELRPFLGKDVEITVKEAVAPKEPQEKKLTDEQRRTRLKGSVLAYEDPFGPAVVTPLKKRATSPVKIDFAAQLRAIWGDKVFTANEFKLMRDFER